MYPELYDREKLLSLLRKNMSVRDIADHLGCTRTNVESALKNHGIKRPYVANVSKEAKQKLRL